jgi:hypothetical protein
VGTILITNQYFSTHVRLYLIVGSRTQTGRIFGVVKDHPVLVTITITARRDRTV